MSWSAHLSVGLSAVMLSVAACAHMPSPTGPSNAEVQAVERARVWEPFTDYAPDGRAYAEFAPMVETRAVVCTSLSPDTYECAFESRAKDYFSADFSPWEKRHDRLEWRNGHWIGLARADPHGG